MRGRAAMAIVLDSSRVNALNGGERARSREGRREEEGKGEIHDGSMLHVLPARHVRVTSGSQSL